MNVSVCPTADYDDLDTSPYGTEAHTYWTAYDTWEQEQVST